MQLLLCHLLNDDLLVAQVLIFTAIYICIYVYLNNKEWLVYLGMQSIMQINHQHREREKESHTLYHWKIICLPLICKCDVE